MKLKKLTVICFIMLLLLSQFAWLSNVNYVYADESRSASSEAQVSGNFHYEQLGAEAKKIYQAMYKMYIEGVFKTGTESLDLVKNGFFTEEEIKKYDKNNTELMSSMNAARYAFYADYPEVFYVEFQKLSIRTTKDAENHYHAYLGSGRFANYYIEGFSSQTQVEQAIGEFNNRVNEIAEKARNIEVEANKNKTAEQIKLVHNEIIYNTGYRLETDCKAGNEGFISTPYGALVKKEAVCEGYARAFKTILDKVEINNILVQGIHQSEGSAAVPHMWNYIQIEKDTAARAVEKVWYAVDCTMDDPFLRDSTFDTTDPDFVPGSDIKEGFENTRYCIVGTETMNKEYVALETVEAAGNYTFKYPELQVEDYGTNNIVNDNGLLVKFKQEGTEGEDYKAGDFYISYNNKGYAEAVKEGKYILMKYHEYRPGDEEWIEGNWGYMNPELYAPGAFNDNGDHLYISVPNSEYVEFAVTTLAPSDGIAGLTYQGDGSDFVAQSGKLYNPNGTYKAPPYIKYQTPAPVQTLTVGPTYHVDVTYDDDLVLAEGATEAGYRMESTGTTGAAESKIENFTFDGKRRITFDLTFSKMFADDNAMYRIYITGLVGKNSGKEPNYIAYGAANTIACSCRMNAAKSWSLFARPTLIENEDLSMNGWKTSDGESVSDKLKNRIALVTTRTTGTEQDAMNHLMQNEVGSQNLVTSETYNISLNVCKKVVVTTGHKLRLSLGFPAGYGPDDAGVTFKAYHFKRDSAGNVTGIEEIPCVVTQYGLIVTCDSFSPFAIAVVKEDGTTPKNKSVVVSSTEGGNIEGANRAEGNIVTLAEGGSVTLHVKPEEGYEIEAVTVCDKVIEITNKNGMDITVNDTDVKGKNCIVDAKFVAKEVVKAEEERGENVVVQDLVIPDENKPEIPDNPVKPENPDEPNTPEEPNKPEVPEISGKLDDIDITPYLFNSTYYADMNADLKNAFGYDENALKNHYMACGIREGRQASPVFDVKYYLEHNGDLRSAYGEEGYEKAYQHFVICGMREGRKASKYFNAAEYLEKNVDIKIAYKNNVTYAVMHFAVCGIQEGREGSNEFNVINYYNECSDFVKKKLEKNYIKYYALDHGADVAGVKPINIANYMFDSDLYYSLYPDLQIAIGNNEELLKQHYLACGIKEGRMGSYAFDADYYLNHNADLKKAFGEEAYEKAYEHFVNCGINEGRIASQYFDVKYYLSENEDLRKAFDTNYSRALEHFVNCGISEKRKASEEFNAEAYKNNYSDLSNAFDNKWKQYVKHYILAGQQEGRKCV